MIEKGLPARMLVLETVPSSELLQLRHHSLHKLFQFSGFFQWHGLNDYDPASVTKTTGEMVNLTVENCVETIRACSPEVPVDSATSVDAALS